VSQLVNYNGKLFLVKRTFKVSELKSDFDTNVMKEWTRTDTLLRKDGLLYCCELIPEAEIIEQ
jgi:hypothetical protein